jgi:hypothetical protein
MGKCKKRTLKAIKTTPDGGMKMFPKQHRQSNEPKSEREMERNVFIFIKFFRIVEVKR